jgi:hypothetical protein
MGSGRVGVAAMRLGRRFRGSDINPEAGGHADRLRPFGEGRPGPARAAADLLELADSL